MVLCCLSPSSFYMVNIVKVGPFKTACSPPLALISSGFWPHVSQSTWWALHINHMCTSYNPCDHLFNLTPVPTRWSWSSFPKQMWRESPEPLIQRKDNQVGSTWRRPWVNSLWTQVSWLTNLVLTLWDDHHWLAKISAVPWMDQWFPPALHPSLHPSPSLLTILWSLGIFSLLIFASVLPLFPPGQFLLNFNVQVRPHFHGGK